MVGFHFHFPRFGVHCACCGRDAQGRTQPYDPSTDRLNVSPVLVPVCFDCESHFRRSTSAITIAASGLVVGVAGTGLAMSYLQKRPNDSFLWGMLGVSLLIGVAAISWVVDQMTKEKSLISSGHHVAFGLVPRPDGAVLTTGNITLVKDLLRTNPGARVKPELPAESDGKVID